ncbi:uncharacterized protein PGTG_21941 [Puccinia graminis f. sp. tritici CRL 75-36-700-3]|uniref:Uncharacterized protein n=1 Tax=Puccinia graminis f. sp. tritici (strain CRL 75-36-700-3 / race SCCL) TaxID=418459 RepID=H6QSW8_PUCGT|nr:uncharacterized protein PGTG_21941 [Puccinia graminis f. sp. tritici CRL 75-36-700-3]EHS63922.1 hypothetical protein PGTG_21941 [Puccinia graminis f. sp. tritici CRL 75-36-700-3]
MPTQQQSQCSPSKTPSIDDSSESNPDKVTIIETSGPSAAQKTKMSTQDKQSSWVWQNFQTQAIDGKKWNTTKDLWKL